MTVKNLVIFGAFDQNAPGFASQSSVFASAVEQVLEADSGVALNVSQLGRMRVSGGSDAVTKVLVDIPTTGDNDTDKLNGSLVALSSVDPGFTSALGATLQASTGYSSALLDVSSSQQAAIINQPPGLVIDIPNPDIAFVSAISPSPGTLLFNLYLQNSPLAAGASISQAFSFTASAPSVATPNSYAMRVVPPGVGVSSFVPGTLTYAPAGIRFKVETSYTLAGTNGGAYVLTADGDLIAAAITRNGSSTGVTGSSYGTMPATGPNKLNSLFQTTSTGIHFARARVEKDGFPSAAVFKNLNQLAGSVTTALATASTGILTLKNNTLNPIPVGQYLADCAVFATSVMEL